MRGAFGESLIPSPNLSRRERDSRKDAPQATTLSFVVSTEAAA